MNRDYQIISKKNSGELAKFLSKEGQLLLPMLELIEQAEAAVDEVIDVVGRASIEAILLLSAQQVAGTQHKGKNTGDILRFNTKQGKHYRVLAKGAPKPAVRRIAPSAATGPVSYSMKLSNGKVVQGTLGRRK